MGVTHCFGLEISTVRSITKKLLTLCAVIALVSLGTAIVVFNRQQHKTYAFDVPELGISLTLPKELRDLEQARDTGGEGKVGADFSTSSLEALGGPTCKAGATESVSPYPLGQVVRANEKPAQVAAERKAIPEEALGEYIGKVGDEYLYYQTAPTEACSQAPGAALLQESQTVLLKQALKSARDMEQ